MSGNLIGGMNLGWVYMYLVCNNVVYNGLILKIPLYQDHIYIWHVDKGEFFLFLNIRSSLNQIFKSILITLQLLYLVCNNVGYNELIRDRRHYQDHIYIWHVDNVSSLYLKSSLNLQYNPRLESNEVAVTAIRLRD